MKLLLIISYYSPVIWFFSYISKNFFLAFIAYFSFFLAYFSFFYQPLKYWHSFIFCAGISFFPYLLCDHLIHSGDPSDMELPFSPKFFLILELSHLFQNHLSKLPVDIPLFCCVYLVYSMSVSFHCMSTLLFLLFPQTWQEASRTSNIDHADPLRATLSLSLCSPSCLFSLCCCCLLTIGHPAPTVPPVQSPPYFRITASSATVSLSDTELCIPFHHWLPAIHSNDLGWVEVGERGRLCPKGVCKITVCMSHTVYSLGHRKKVLACLFRFLSEK